MPSLATAHKSHSTYPVQADLVKQAHAGDTSSKQISNGLASKDSGEPDVSKALAAGLRMLADEVEGQPELLSRAADLMSMDFMNSRAPPAQVGPLLVLLCILHVPFMLCTSYIL